jgi:glycosyltransferase involved in cell wall biosynthesis
MPDDAFQSETTLHREINSLRAENARLTALVERTQASAAVQGLRAAAKGGEAHTMRLQVKAVQSSFFWRLTLPLRLAVDLARGIPPTASADALRLKRAATLLRREGARAVWDLAVRQLRWRRRLRANLRSTQLAAVAQEALPPSMPEPAAILAPCVLIIAELSLQQCAKYRVWQKQEHFERLGQRCRVVDWRRTEDCLSAAALATQVILYRVPGYPEVLRMIAAMQSLRLPLLWEVDDIIFDDALFLQNRNLDSLDPVLREEILSGVGLYRAAMAACGAGIASTPHLAAAMRASGMTDVVVIENALDAETLRLADDLRARHRPPRDHVLITYGSGTKTHNADFLEAAVALLRLLRSRPDVRLRIVGELTLPPGFDTVGAQVEHLPPTPFAGYLALLAESDISLAPLENTPFNDAKSNIKFLEAAILGIPSVCSPRAHFTEIVLNDQTGLLAEGDEGWFEALSRLAGDADLRRRIGQAAHQAAVSRYAPDAVARSQVAPLLARAPDRRRAAPLRALFANIYYAPRSYGGATLVVEEMTRRLHARGDVDVHVYTGLALEAPERATRRTDQDGITVFAVPTSESDLVAAFDDPIAAARFGDVLDAVQPDVVHLHAIQGLSASLTAACTARGIPYVITLHDAWYLCARQFMVREDSQYCFQTRIDLRVCQNCIPGAYHLEDRARLMHAALHGAALLLSPSQAHRALHLANGIAPEKIEVAPNGVRLPTSRPTRVPHDKLRFAFVGGNVDVKGYYVTMRAFQGLDRADWRLVLVDNTLNLGFSSIDVADWTVQGEVRVVAAYKQEEIDDFFDGIDVLVFPSQWKESFGLTVREALARDVWVIATEGGGPAEAIVDGVNGTLIPLDGRAEPLRDAIVAILDRPGRLAGYRNPFANAIMDYAAQAATLHATLTRVAAAGAVDHGF